ncbi:MAG TPA: hypothetical protein ENK43_00740 [Planctomycetes bacterium]|nr:hypothetical protein [Planctomycetota bacterium]
MLVLLTPIIGSHVTAQQPVPKDTWFEQLLGWVHQAPENARVDWKLETKEIRPPISIADLAERAVAEDGLEKRAVDQVVREYACEWYGDEDVITRTRAGYCHFGARDVRVAREFGKGSISDPGPDLVGCEFQTDRLVARTPKEFIGVARGEFVHPDGRHQADRVTATRRLLGDVTESAEFDVFPLLGQKSQLENVLFEMSPIDIEQFASTGSYVWDISHAGQLPHDVWIPSRTLIRRGAISSIEKSDELEIRLSLSRSDGTVLSSVSWTFAKAGSALVLSEYSASISLPNGHLRQRRDLTILRRRSAPLIESTLSFDRVVPDGATVHDSRYEPTVVYTKFAGMTDDDVAAAALLADSMPRKGVIEDGVKAVNGGTGLDSKSADSSTRAEGWSGSLFWPLAFVLILTLCVISIRRRSLRRIMGFFLTFYLLLGCSGRGEKSAPHFAASVALSQPTRSIELGDFLWGGPGDVHIELVNDTSLPEAASSVYSDCSCLVTLLSPVIIAPGGSVDIPLRVDTGLPGERSVSLSLRRDGQPEIPLCKASFTVRWGLRPSAGRVLEWSYVHRTAAETDAAPSNFVFFLDEDGIKVERIDRVSLVAPPIISRVDKERPGRWRVEFPGGESLPVGSFSSVVKVEFTSNGIPCSLHLPIRITASHPDDPLAGGLEDILMGLVPTGKTKKVVRRIVPMQSGWTIADVHPLEPDTKEAPTCDIVENGTAIRVCLTGRNERKRMMRWTFVATLSPDGTGQPIRKIFEILAAY